jgi:hypothetical protein
VVRDLRAEAPRPVFIIGSSRSGTSILTWALGQHPNLLPVEETLWLDKLAVDLRSTYQEGRKSPVSQLATMGIKMADFYAAFGQAANDMILSHGRYDSDFAQNVDKGSPFRRYRSATDPKTRWVDGTPKYSLHVYELLELFPSALFIHLLRDVRLVVASLMNFDRAGASARSAETAYGEWYSLVSGCADAERAFGSKTIMRVRHADLLSDPDRTIWRCLDFLGEPFNTFCLEPLEQVINSSGPSVEAPIPEQDPFSVAEKAIHLSDELLAEPEPAYEPDLALQAVLRAKSPLNMAAYLLPVEGPAFQVGPAAGFCDDFWVDGSLSATMRVEESIGKITVEGNLPSMGVDGQVSLILRIDGNEFQQAFTPGQEVSWTVPCAIPRQRKVELSLASSQTFSPKREGLSNDQRELALFLKRIVFSP